MKYYIEFELPDNDVVLELIEHEWVKWGVWGYSGYAYAKPVACEKPDLSTMLFSERKELADKYEQWAKKNCVKDCALSVISYLCAFGYIPTLFNRERKHGKCIEELPSAEPETHDKRTETHACVCEHTETHVCVSPCDVCRHYPPSSADGKPCSMCPAEPTEQVRTYASLADCVSRQAAVDTLNRQAEAMQEWSERYAEQRKGVLSAVNLIEDLPSAQPEIIRCKDCRWGRKACGNIECFVDRNTPPEYHGYEWFCPNGERRTDGSD